MNLREALEHQLECLEVELNESQRRGDQLDEKRLRNKIKQLKIKNK